MSEPESVHNEWPSAEEKAKSVAQAIALKERAKFGGLRFSVYLPPRLAEWLLGLVEKGTFLDPSEAAFVLLQEQKELEPHDDLRHELLNRILQAAEDDLRPGIPAEEVFRKLKERRPLPEPAEWKK
jgi:antitoxin ParD1/3/4